METKEDGKITLELSPEDAKRLTSLLARGKSGVQRPRVQRIGNQIVIDTGLDSCATINHGPHEVHALRIYQRAGSHSINGAGEVDPQSVVPAISIIERIEENHPARFCYFDGSPVERKSDLEIIPPVHRAAALKWFSEKYGDKTEIDEAEPQEVNAISEESEPTPEEEPKIELSLKDRVAILLTTGLNGKQIAKKLGCCAGTVSIHRKSAIKEKILDKSGKKFTALGLEKYHGQVEQQSRFSRS